MLIPELLTSGFSPLGLDILSFGAILSGILVITARNPVISVLFLIALFVNIAGYLILLGISFIGLAYITVYVGAIAILFGATDEASSSNLTPSVRILSFKSSDSRKIIS